MTQSYLKNSKEMKKHLGKISDYRGLKDTRLIALLHTGNEQ